ncbi:MAG TPA: ABC transporter permease subunit [Anaerolineae bacterium]|nr:ABC transporter permease subunit [Anaerolineae bacterium]
MFRHTLRRLRGQMIGWGLALAVLGFGIASLFNTVSQMRDQIEQLIGTLPPAVLAFAGNIDRMFSPAGYLDARYFLLMPLILGVFTVVIGSGLIANDEENGTLDLILAQPISRTQLFLGRWLAFLGALIGILFIAWLGLVIAIVLTSIDLNPLQVALPFLSLFGILIWFGSFALMLSLIVPSRRAAASLSGLLLVASYFITTLARVSTDLAVLAKFSPLNYYQGGDALNGLNVVWLAGLLIASIVFTAIAWWWFQRRDIRVFGEGTWGLNLSRIGAKMRSH